MNSSFSLAHYTCLMALLVVSSCSREKFIDNSADFIPTPVLEGLQVKVEAQPSDQGYQVVWFLDSKVKPGEQFEVRQVETKKFFALTQPQLKEIPAPQHRYNCSPHEHLNYEIKKVSGSEVIETQKIQVICPMDIVMGNQKDEELLARELANPDRKQIVIGKWVFPDTIQYRIRIAKDTQIFVNKLRVNRRSTTLAIDYHDQTLGSLHKMSQAIGFDLALRKWTQSPTQSQSVYYLRKDLDPLLSSNRPNFKSASLEIRSKVTLEIFDGEGSLNIVSRGTQGGEGLPGTSIFDPAYLTQLRTRPAQPGPARNGSFNFRGQGDSQLDVGRSPDPCEPTSEPQMGHRGTDGALPGVPGADGGPGIPNIPITISVTYPSPDFQLSVAISPGEGGIGGAGTPGQPGGLGGEGGLIACDRSRGRAASGPNGQDAPKGADGNPGPVSVCNSVAISKNLISRINFVPSKNCPNVVTPQFTGVNQTSWQNVIVKPEARTPKENNSSQEVETFTKPVL